VDARDLTAHEAAERLERRGGRLLVEARVREGGARFPTEDVATYQYLGREAEATVITGPAGRRWLLRTDADRASLADDMARVRDKLNARPGRPGLVYVFSHRDELQSDGGYGQIGCFLSLISTAVGLTVGVVVASLVTDGPNVGYAIVGPIAGFLAAMFTADALGSLLTGIPALRDRVAKLIDFYMAIVPGLITFLVIVIGSALPA
jgi:hypothetical protein